MHFSCVLAPTLQSPEHIVVAEQLGYERAWLFDTPQQGPDVWMTLGRAAELTDTIGIGPGVLVPSLRHPMSAAAPTATLDIPCAGTRRRGVRHRIHRSQLHGPEGSPVVSGRRLRAGLPRPDPW
jgi:Luciferase-like monooxygenase